MAKRNPFFIAALALVACATPNSINGQAGTGLEVGSPFPELQMPYMLGDRAGSIRDFRGAKVVLHVFASW